MAGLEGILYPMSADYQGWTHPSSTENQHPPSNNFHTKHYPLPTLSNPPNPNQNTTGIPEVIPLSPVRSANRVNRGSQPHSAQTPSYINSEERGRNRILDYGGASGSSPYSENVGYFGHRGDRGQTPSKPSLLPTSARKVTPAKTPTQQQQSYMRPPLSFISNSSFSDPTFAPEVPTSRITKTSAQVTDNDSIQISTASAVTRPATPKPATTATPTIQRRKKKKKHVAVESSSSNSFGERDYTGVVTDEEDIESIWRTVPIPDSDSDDLDYGRSRKKRSGSHGSRRSSSVAIEGGAGTATRKRRRGGSSLAGSMLSSEMDYSCAGNADSAWMQSATDGGEGAQKQQTSEGIAGGNFTGSTNTGVGGESNNSGSGGYGMQGVGSSGSGGGDDRRDDHNRNEPSTGNPIASPGSDSSKNKGKHTEADANPTEVCTVTPAITLQSSHGDVDTTTQPIIPSKQVQSLASSETIQEMSSLSVEEISYITIDVPVRAPSPVEVKPSDTRDSSKLKISQQTDQTTTTTHSSQSPSSGSSALSSVDVSDVSEDETKKPTSSSKSKTSKKPAKDSPGLKNRLLEGKLKTEHGVSRKRAAISGSAENSDAETGNDYDGSDAGTRGDSDDDRRKKSHLSSDVRSSSSKSPHARTGGVARSKSGGGPNDPEISLGSRHKRGIRQSAVNKPNLSGRTPIFKYAGTGDVEAVTALINAGADVNVRDNAGWTPLHEACLEGQKETCELLISYGADVNAAGFGGDTPLHDAVSNGHFEVVESLLSHGAYLSAANEKGETPLDLAADDEDEDDKDHMSESSRLGSPTKSGPSPPKGSSKMERLLLRWKEMMTKVLEVDSEGLTMLHQAAKRGDLKNVKRALRYGADVDFKDNAGWTPLHEACAKGLLEVAEELCKHGADVNSMATPVESGKKSESSGGPRLAPVGVTPLMDAAASRSTEIVMLLLQFGANPSAKDNKGRTSLDYCVDDSISGLSGFRERVERENAVAEIKSLLGKPAESWKPYRRPDFVKTIPGAAGMMANIRDQASGGRFGFKHVRRNSLGSETSMSTNPAAIASRNQVTAATAAAIGLGGPNPFSWGGLDPKDQEGPFASKRDERKFNALLKTIQASEAGEGSVPTSSPQATSSSLASATKKVTPASSSGSTQGSTSKTEKRRDETDDSKKKADRERQDSQRKQGASNIPQIKKRLRDDSNVAGESKPVPPAAVSSEKPKKPKLAETDDLSKPGEPRGIKRPADSSNMPGSVSKATLLSIGTIKKKKVEEPANTNPSPPAGASEKKSVAGTSSSEKRSSTTVSPDKTKTEPEDPLFLFSDETSTKSKKESSSAAQAPTKPSKATATKLPILSSAFQKPASKEIINPASRPSSKASSQAGTPLSQPSNLSVMKKKPVKKKMDWLGISGYQKAGDETPPTNPNENLTSSVKPEPSSEMSITMEESSALATPTPAIVKDQSPPPKATLPPLSLRRACLPLYKVAFPPDASDTTAQSSGMEPTKKSNKTYIVDLQLAYFMGLKSGREVLERHPGLTSKVASDAEKRQLQYSAVAESIFEAVMRARGLTPDMQPPKFIKWHQIPGSGRRALRLDHVDIQLFDAAEVDSMLEMERVAGETTTTSAATATDVVGCGLQPSDFVFLLELAEVMEVDDSTTAVIGGGTSSDLLRMTLKNVMADNNSAVAAHKSYIPKLKRMGGAPWAPLALGGNG